MIRRGLYFARRGFISLSLPLEASDYDDFVDAFADFLDEHREVLSDGATARAGPAGGERGPG